MDSQNNWLKQSPDKPLFPDLLWSRPENRAHAGKLLIVGGNAQGFAAPAEAYNLSQKAGIGTATVLLPDALKKVVGPVIENGEYAPSTPSGSFSQKALDELLLLAGWADGVLLSGDLGRNSETAVLLEKFAAKYSGQLTITKDAGDYFTSIPSGLKQRENTTLVISFAQLQRLGTHLKFTIPFTFDMDLVRLIAALQAFTTECPFNIVVKHLDTILVAANGQVSSTHVVKELPIWRVQVAAHASVWWLQNPSKAFEALSTAVFTAVDNIDV